MRIPVLTIKHDCEEQKEEIGSNQIAYDDEGFGWVLQDTSGDYGNSYHLCDLGYCPYCGKRLTVGDVYPNCTDTYCDEPKNHYDYDTDSSPSWTCDL